MIRIMEMHCESTKFVWKVDYFHVNFHLITLYNVQTCLELSSSGPASQSMSNSEKENYMQYCLKKVPFVTISWWYYCYIDSHNFYLPDEHLFRYFVQGALGLGWDYIQVPHNWFYEKISDLKLPLLCNNQSICFQV